MYPHSRGGGGGPGQSGGNGGGDHGDNSFANFMRSNDPHSVSSGIAGDGDLNSSGGGFSGPSSSSSAAAAMRQHPGRGMTMTTPSARHTQGQSRRVTSTAVRMPSMRSLGGGPSAGPMELAVMDGATGVEPAGLQGVAVGTIYDTDSSAHSGGGGGGSRGVVGGGGSSHQLQHDYANNAPPPNSAAGFANGSGGTSHRMLQGTTPPAASLPNTTAALGGSAAADAYLPNAPYQEMMQTYGREDPTVERARMSMAGSNRKQQADLPAPVPGLPQEPTSPAMEPTIPASRLGRRILTQQKPERQPDFVHAKLAAARGGGGGSSSANIMLSLNRTHVECAACRATIEIPKSAVVVLCPSCDQVHPAASCRVVRVGQ